MPLNKKQLKALSGSELRWLYLELDQDFLAQSRYVAAMEDIQCEQAEEIGRLERQLESVISLNELLTEDNTSLREQRGNLIGANDRLTLLFEPFYPEGSRSRLRLGVENLLVSLLIRLRGNNGA